MRVVVVGTSGSGKSTFAGRLAVATGLPHVELDLLNWGPDWFDRSKRTPDAFVQSVADATAGPAWVIAGGYRLVRPLTWGRATDLVWLDLPRPLIMRQVVLRSLGRAISRREEFPGCREDWRRLLGPDHPIRFAWTTFHRRRETFTAMTADPAYAHLAVHRCRSRSEVKAALRALTSRRPCRGPEPAPRRS